MSGRGEHSSPGPGDPLVTGATGFAGSHLLDHLLQHHERVHAWGNPGGRPIGSRSPDGRITWSAVDVTSREDVARALGAIAPGVVYHCAGLAHVHHAWQDSARALRVNVMGTDAVLRGVADAGLRIPVVVTGSALVYRPSTQALTEESPVGPTDPYGLSKLAQEMLAAAAGGHVLVARPFNHAGPRQGTAFVTSSFARQIAEAEAGVRAPVIRVGNLDARRDVTDVRDTVRAYRLLALGGEAGRPYNICRGQAHRVGDLLEALIARARVPISVELDPARLRPSDNPVVLGSYERIRRETGWEPRIPIEQTLDDLLDYWRGEVAREQSG